MSLVTLILNARAYHRAIRAVKVCTEKLTRTMLDASIIPCLSDWEHLFIHLFSQFIPCIWGLVRPLQVTTYKISKYHALKPFYNALPQTINFVFICLYNFYPAFLCKAAPKWLTNSIINYSGLDEDKQIEA